MLFFTRQLARIIGVLLLGFGVGGFFADGYIGFMQTNPALNFFNIITGVLGIASARTYRYAKNWLFVFGIIFAIFGLIILINGNLWNTFNTNSSGAVVYVCLGIGMLAASSLLRPSITNA